MRPRLRSTAEVGLWTHRHRMVTGLVSCSGQTGATHSGPVALSTDSSAPFKFLELRKTAVGAVVETILHPTATVDAEMM